MDIRRKNLKFNNGEIFSFDFIKKNREQATYEMAEGNLGLYQLLNTCIDLDVPTLSCCGDIAPMIMFDYNDNTKHLLCSLWAYLESIYSNEKLYFHIYLSNYEHISDRQLCIRVKSVKDSILVFFIIEAFLKSPQYIDDYSFYEELDAILERLAKTYDSSYIGDGHFYNDKYKYIIYTGAKRNLFDKTPRSFRRDTKYISGENFRHYFHYYGLNSEEEIKNFMYALYDGIHMKTKEHPHLESFVYKLEKLKAKR